MRFFLTNSAKTPLYLHSIYALSYFNYGGSVGPGFEPGLELEFFVSQAEGRGFEPLLRHNFFAISMSRKISQCLAGVLF